MRKTVSGEVVSINEPINIMGEKNFEEFGSIYYNFPKRNIEIIVENKQISIEFVGKNKIHSLLKYIEVGLIYEFDLEETRKYNNIYYKCLDFNLLKNSRKNIEIDIDDKKYNLIKTDDNKELILKLISQDDEIILNSIVNGQCFVDDESTFFLNKNILGTKVLPTLNKEKIIKNFDIVRKKGEEIQYKFTLLV